MALAPINPTQLTPPRVALIDERSGAISREWYRFFLSLLTATETNQQETGTAPDANALMATYDAMLASLAQETQTNTSDLSASLQQQINDVFTATAITPPPSGGTVTSVDASGGSTGLLFTGGPITTSGTLTLSGTLVAVNGGTGFSSYTVGDILFASSTTALSKLADVATGNALISGGVGVAPLYGKIGLTTHVSGTLPVGNGGTGTATAFTAGSVVFAGVSGTYTQNNAQLFWDNANNRLGVGNATPAATLDVTGNIRMSGANPNIELNSGGPQVYVPAASTLSFATGGGIGTPVERFRIGSAGQWGIGGATYGTSGQVFTSGGASAAPTWTTPTTGTVTSVSGTGTVNGITLTGTVTSSGSLTLGGTLSNVSLTTQVTGTLPVGNGGTGTATAFTAGSVVFAGALGVYSQNNGQFFWDGVNSRLGIGTSSPGKKLDLVGQFRASGSAASGYALLEYGTSATATNNWHVGSEGDGTFRWYNGTFGAGTERMRITSAGNVGIGTTSPAERLTVNSASSEFAIQWSGPGNEWVLASAANRSYIRNKTASVETLTILNAGNVGIGTSSPATKLDVIGAVRSTGGFSSNATTAFQPQTSMSNSASDATGGYYIFYKGRAGSTTSLSGDTLGTLLWYGYDTGNTAVATSSIFTIQTAAAGVGSVPTALVFTNGGNSERMRIDNSGNVGIGTSSPATKLHVYAASGYNEIRVASGANNLGLAINGSVAYLAAFQSTPLTFQTNSVECMRIDTSGNVGIGTSSPAQRLHVATTAAPSGTTQSFLRATASQTYGADFGGGIIQGVGPIATISTVNAGTVTERMRIDSSGNVGIGTTGPGYRLDVASGDTTASIGYAMRIRSNATATAAAVQFTNSGASSQTGLVTCTDTGTMTIQSDGASSLLAFRTNGNERMRIASNGNVGIGTSTFGTSAVTVIGIANGTAPTTSPAGMGQLYVEAGALKYRGSSGTVTTIANA